MLCPPAGRRVFSPRPVRYADRGGRSGDRRQTEAQHMARAKRSTGVLDTLSKRGEAAVKRATRRVSTGARTAGGPAPELIKAVQSLVKALPIGELEKRLAGLEKSVARLEGEIRKAVERGVSAVRGTGATTRKKATLRKAAATTTRRATGTSGAATTRKATTRKAATATPRKAAATATTRRATAGRPRKAAAATATATTRKT